MYRNSAQNGNERRLKRDGQSERRYEGMSENEQKETKNRYIRREESVKYEKRGKTLSNDEIHEGTRPQTQTVASLATIETIVATPTPNGHKIKRQREQRVVNTF